MRFLLAGLTAAVCCFGQSVQSAADVGTYSVTGNLVPGTREVVSYNSLVWTPTVTSASVSILPAGSTTPVPAQDVSLDINSSSIGFVVPQSLPVGDAVLIYKAGNTPSQWVPVTIVASSFSLFRSGTNGPLIALNLTPDSNGAYFDNGLTHPAQPGEAVMLWGAGLGLTSPNAVQITLGGVPQTILYAGDTPGISGLNQINFQIAPGTPDGCYVPLVVNYGSQSFNSFLSKTSDGMPCRHPYGLSINAMKLLDSGASIPVETVSLSTAINAPAADSASRQESAEADQVSWTASDFADSVLQPAAVAGPQCVLAANSSLAILDGGLYSGTSGIGLQNGVASLSLPWSSPQAVDASLTSLPAAVLTGGNWTLHVPASSGLSGGTLTFSLPPPIEIQDGTPITIDHTQNRTVTWDRSGFDSTALVQLSITQQGGTSMINCSAPASAGAITIPANLLSGFAAGAVGALSAIVVETGAGVPHAQLSSLFNLSFVQVEWRSTDTRPVDFQ